MENAGKTGAGNRLVQECERAKCFSRYDINTRYHMYIQVWGLTPFPAGHYYERVIGTEEDLRKYISRLVEKRVQNNAL